jgi:hypothetical protein
VISCIAGVFPAEKEWYVVIAAHRPEREDREVKKARKTIRWKSANRQQIEQIEKSQSGNSNRTAQNFLLPGDGSSRRRPQTGEKIQPKPFFRFDPDWDRILRDKEKKNHPILRTDQTRAIQRIVSTNRCFASTDTVSHY